MKFKADSKKLGELFRAVTKGYQPKEDSSYVYFDVTEDKLTVVARSTAAYFEGSVEITDVELAESGNNTYYVDGETLKQLTGIFPTVSMELSFEVGSTRIFKITWPAHNFKLPITSDFTSPKRPVAEELGSVDGIVFNNALGDLLKIADGDSTAQNHQISCIHLYLKDKEATLMATDRFALAVITNEFFPAEDEQDEYTALVRNTQAALLQKKCLPGEVFTLIKTKDNMFGYIDNEDVISLVSSVDLPPLDYSQLADRAGGDCNIVVNKDDLKYAIETVSKVSFGDNDIQLDVDPTNGILQISTLSGNIADVSITEKANIEDSKQFNFNKDVLLEALSPVTTKNIRLEWPDEETELTMTKIVPIEDNGGAVENILIVAITSKIKSW